MFPRKTHPLMSEKLIPSVHARSPFYRFYIYVRGKTRNRNITIITDAIPVKNSQLI